MDSTPDCGEIITKSFLQDVLKEEGKYKGVEILSYNAALGTKPGDNYMSIIYTIDLEMRLTSGKVTKRSLLIKCYPNHPGRQEFTNRSNMFYKEMVVYAKWMPELYRMQREFANLNEEEIIKLPYAPYVHGQCIDFDSEEGKGHSKRLLGSLENYIMMEDIKKMYGFRMTNRRESLDIHHMQLAFKALAKVHSLSWAYRQHVEPNITDKFKCMVPNFTKEDMEMWSGMVKGCLTQAAVVLDEMLYKGNRLSEATLRYRDVTINAVMDFFMGETEGTVFENAVRVKIDPKKYGRPDNYEEKPWRIICHGDCWSNNMMFRYDPKSHLPVEITLLDLQMPSEACVVNDLEYVVYASTNAELRKNHLDDLLKLYFDEFTTNCNILKVETLPGFTLAELKYRFERAKLLGFFMASMGLPIMLKEEEKAKNLEDMGQDEDIEGLMSAMTEGGDNSVYRTRLLEVTRDLYEQGII